MTVSRVILALLAGAVTGGLLVALFDLFFTVFVLQDPKHDWKYAPLAIYSTFAMASAVWLIGLVVIGAPFWFLMHKMQFTSWVHVVLTVPILMFFVVFALKTQGFGFFQSDMGNFSAWEFGGSTWIDGRMTLHGWFAAAGVSLVFSLYGLVVALAVWGVAYKIRWPSF